MTDPLGQSKNYSYFLDNDLKALTYTGAVHATPNVTFAYDPYFQRIISMADGNGTRQYQYYAPGVLGALKRKQESGPYLNDTIAYQYDALGRVIQQTVDTAAETFTYDVLGRLSNHFDALGSFDLSFLGQTSQMTSRMLHGSALGTNWTYDSNTNDRRLTDITNSGATRSYHYTTTPENIITQISELAPSGSAFTPQTWNYGYDNADRLLNASAGASYAYGYDAADNITSAQGPSGSESGTYNDVNQIGTFNGLSFLYDTNGNVTDDGVRTYMWDVENRLISIGYKSQPTRTTTFRYDGLGRRTSIVSTNGVISTEVRYLWCGQRLCQARNSSDTVVRRYYSEGEVVPASGTLLYYAKDHLGSVRDVLAIQNGSRVASFDYDPYGNPTQSNGRITTDFRFAGVFYEQNSGLYLTEYRAYDPKTSRWLSRDQLGESGGINVYGYVKNNPVRNIDPLGLHWEYSQGTGQWTNVNDQTGARTPEGTGYSGNGEGLNNPAMQSTPNVGPIPQGSYIIGPQQDNTTNSGTSLPQSMRLTPQDGTDTFGRSGFIIHGDNSAGDNSASEGCPIANRGIRNQIGSSGDDTLQVVP